MQTRRTYDVSTVEDVRRVAENRRVGLVLRHRPPGHYRAEVAEAAPPRQPTVLRPGTTGRRVAEAAAPPRQPTVLRRCPADPFMG